MCKLYLTLFILCIACSCATTKPKDFTYLYDREYTGLDTLINIDGYYLFQRECDSTFYSVVMFYPDGLFTIATGSDLSSVVNCYANENQNSAFCDYPLWGVYRVEGGLIKTQAIRQEGMEMYTIFRDYEIKANKKLVNKSEYVYPQNSKIGYLNNYPSFFENSCAEDGVFHPLKEKKSAQNCPYINKKWFNTRN